MENTIRKKRVSTSAKVKAVAGTAFLDLDEDVRPFLYDLNWIPVLLSPGKSLLVGYSYQACTGKQFDWIKELQESIATVGEAVDDEDKSADEAAAFEMLRNQVFEFLLSVDMHWQLTLKGEPIPHDVDGLKSVPFVLCRIIFNAIVTDVRPNPTGA